MRLHEFMDHKPTARIKEETDKFPDLLERMCPGAWD